jgi:hypothetical protein
MRRDYSIEPLNNPAEGIGEVKRFSRNEVGNRYPDYGRWAVRNMTDEEIWHIIEYAKTLTQINNHVKAWLRDNRQVLELRHRS